MARILIDAETGAASGYFKIDTSDELPCSIIAYGFDASETADIQVSHDNGTTFADLYVDGSQVQLSDTNTMVGLYSPGIFKVNKGVTTGTVTIVQSTIKNV